MCETPEPGDKRSRAPDSIGSGDLSLKRIKKVLNMSVEGEVNNELEELITKKLEDVKKDIISVIKDYVTKQVEVLESRVLDMEIRNDSLQAENERLHEKMEDMKERVAKAEALAVENNQYSRRNNIRIFGLPENVEESCKSKVVTFLKDKLDLEMGDQVLVAHRTGIKKTGKVRHVIVQLSNRAAKEKVMGARKVLKGSGSSIGDDLCPEYMALINRMKTIDPLLEIWSWMGIVYMKKPEKEKERLRYYRDWD